MMKRLIAMMLLLHLSSALFAQTQARQQAWGSLKNKVNVSFASSDVRYAQEQVPQVSPQKQWQTTAWKGEKVQAQLLVWADKIFRSCA